MNSKGLATLYERLTPEERFPLILAAIARDDEPERHRLVDSAPEKNFQVSDFFGFGEAFRDITVVHMMALLSLAADYWRALYLGDSRSEDFEALLDQVMIRGYLFQTYLHGWRQFCAERDIDPEAVLRVHPGYDNLQRAERMTERAAFVPEGAERLVRGGGDETVRAVTAQDIAATLHQALEQRLAWWSGRRASPGA